MANAFISAPNGSENKKVVGPAWVDYLPNQVNYHYFSGFSVALIAICSR